MSDIIKQAQQIVNDNGFADKITCIQGKVLLFSYVFRSFLSPLPLPFSYQFGMPPSLSPITFLFLLVTRLRKCNFQLKKSTWSLVNGWVTSCCMNPCSTLLLLREIDSWYYLSHLFLAFLHLIRFPGQGWDLNAWSVFDVHCWSRGCWLQGRKDSLYQFFSYGLPINSVPFLSPFS